MKSSASEWKPFQSRSKGEIPGRARRKEWLSRSKLKQAFLIDSDAEPFMYLIQYSPSLLEDLCTQNVVTKIYGLVRN